MYNLGSAPAFLVSAAGQWVAGFFLLCQPNHPCYETANMDEGGFPGHICVAPMGFTVLVARRQIFYLLSKVNED